MYVHLMATSVVNPFNKIESFVDMLFIAPLFAGMFILSIVFYFKILNVIESTLSINLFSSENKSKLKHRITISLIILPVLVNSYFIFNSFISATDIIYAQERWNEEHPITFESRVEKIEIASLSDKSHREGTGKYGGFLFIQAGKGSVDDVMYYRMMLANGNKKRYYQLPMKETDIIEFEGDSDFPHIEVTWNVAVRDGAIISEETCSDLEGFTSFKGSVSDIIIYVPKGTVSTDFNVDLN